MKTEIALCIFTFNRIEELKKCIASLENCNELNDFDIIVFSDGARNDNEAKQVLEVRDYLTTMDSLSIKEFNFFDKNKGLAQSIITGLDSVFKDYDKVIVLEDDLIVSANFLSFMRQALCYYEKDKNIFSIAGYSPALKEFKHFTKDIYFCPRASSWGFAIWKNRWQSIDWGVHSYPQFKYNFFKQWKFSRGGIDLPGMLRDQMSGRINSWSIRAVYQQFLNDQVTVYPAKSKVKSIGFGKEATHTKKGRRFETTLDIGVNTNFTFEEFNGFDPKIMKDFRKVFSIWNRLKDYLK
jgi:hypothetical protein